MPNVVYRIYTDGRPPELVRGVDLIGTPLAAFGKIVATSNKVEVFNGVCGAESGGVPVSASAPVAARQRGRGAEEVAVAGDAADPAGSRAEKEVLRCRSIARHGRRRRPVSLARAHTVAAAPRAGVADPGGDAGRAAAVDRRPSIEGRTGSVLHRLRSRRGHGHERRRRGSAPSSRMPRGGSGRCRSRCASATTRSTARGSSPAIAARARAPSWPRSTTTTMRCAGSSGWPPTPRTNVPSTCSRERRRPSRTGRAPTPCRISRRKRRWKRCCRRWRRAARVVNGSTGSGRSPRCSRPAPIFIRPRRR